MFKRPAFLSAPTASWLIFALPTILASASVMLALGTAGKQGFTPLNLVQTITVTAIGLVMSVALIVSES